MGQMGSLEFAVVGCEWGRPDVKPPIVVLQHCVDGRHRPPRSDQANQTGGKIFAEHLSEETLSQIDFCSPQRAVIVR